MSGNESYTRAKKDESFKKGEEVKFVHKGRWYSGIVSSNLTAHGLGYYVDADLPSDTPGRMNVMVPRCLPFEPDQLHKVNNPSLEI